MKKNYFAGIFPPVKPLFKSSDYPVDLKPTPPKITEILPPKKIEYIFKGKEKPEERTSNSKLKIYKIHVRSKPITVLDFSGRSHDEMMRYFKNKFGTDLDSAI